MARSPVNGPMTLIAAMAVIRRYEAIIRAQHTELDKMKREYEMLDRNNAFLTRIATNRGIAIAKVERVYRHNGGTA